MTPSLKNQLIFKGNAASAIGGISESAVVVHSGGTEPMRILGQYCIVYVLDGHCLYQHADGTTQTFQAGDFFWVFPDIPHTYAAVPGKTWSQFYVTFAGSAFDQWRSAGVLDPRKFVYHLQPVEYWLGRFQSMLAALPTSDPFSMQPICSLQGLLAEAMESHGHSPAERENVVWLEQAFELIARGDCESSLEMTRIADALGMSYANFRKRFTQLARISPGRYHASLVMRRACQWMHEESVSSKEIARRLNFCNEYHFARRFKQIVGMTPSVYRRQLTRA